MRDGSMGKGLRLPPDFRLLMRSHTDMAARIPIERITE
jgi:hypothetical protein